jgi:hypothetical protein
MQIVSAAIQRVIEIVAGDANEVKALSGDWNPEQSVFMSAPLTEAARARIIAELPQLEYYRQEKTPHNPADEGFADRQSDVVISFPIAGELRRWY